MVEGSLLQKPQAKSSDKNEASLRLPSRSIIPSPGRLIKHTWVSQGSELMIPWSTLWAATGDTPTHRWPQCKTGPDVGRYTEFGRAPLFPFVINYPAGYYLCHEYSTPTSLCRKRIHALSVDPFVAGVRKQISAYQDRLYHHYFLASRFCGLCRPSW